MLYSVVCCILWCVVYCSVLMKRVIFNQRSCVMVTVSLFVCLSTSDFEHGCVFTLKRYQRELGDNLSPLNVDCFCF